MPLVSLAILPRDAASGKSTVERLDMRTLFVIILWSTLGVVLGEEPMHYTNSVGMKFVLITKGKFMMGSPIEYEGRSPEEEIREVTIRKSYYLGVHEVTQWQYEKIMGENPSDFRTGDTKTHPVEGISWEDAVSFCKKLSEMPDEKNAGHEYRLPSEAEWEYACRAGSNAEFCYGQSKDLLDMFAWYEANSGGKTHPVGEKKPNAWGFYDMHGNVFEMCNDWYDCYATDDTIDPKGPRIGPNEFRVARGGSWRNAANDCRSATRGGCQPLKRNNFFGFRIVLDLKVGPLEADHTSLLRPCGVSRHSVLSCTRTRALYKNVATPNQREMRAPLRLDLSLASPLQKPSWRSSELRSSHLFGVKRSSRGSVSSCAKIAL